MKKEIITCIAGESVAVVGTATQTNDTLQTISLIITIVGGVLTIIASCVMPLIRWYKKSKEDGEIDEEEIKEGEGLIKKLVKAIKNFFNKIKNKEGK